MAKLTGEGKKRKGPPTFQHLPVDRARKLKKQWVEKQKIKSSWKAQKRREGIATGSNGILPRRDNRRESRHADPENDDAGPAFQTESSKEASMKHVEEPKDETVAAASHDRTDKSSRSEPAKNSTRLRQERPVTHRQNNKSHNSSTTSKPSVTLTQPVSEDPTVRGLFQKAYSRSSLHSFKADPLHRRRGAANPDPIDTKEVSATHRNLRSGKGRGGHGNQAGGTSLKGRGGQPNMKLHMEAMLAKIKRDYV